jgi:Na+/H+ antiporter NhaD/arsenite permease-like protein
MSARPLLLGCLGVLLWPGAAWAAGDLPLDLPVWSVVPFILLLLAIAILPLAAGKWWHSNFNRGLVSAGFAFPIVAYLVYLYLATGQDTIQPLLHELKNYVAFILLLGSLYTVSGGIVVAGDLQGRPRTNTAFLAVGAVLANLIGTTGASVLLIRPLLRINKQRRFTTHVLIFFIFIVSNLGGLLTPMGDPPLLLGFLHGVPFFWTLTLWPQWLAANGLVLGIFFAWDTIACRREAGAVQASDLRHPEPLRLQGTVNLVLLAGVLAGVLLQGTLPPAYDLFGEGLGMLLMLVMSVLSLYLTPRQLRAANGFTWGPILEVAILFAGIFVTMVPALALLALHGNEFGVSEPWQFFWLTGGLSACLDNAPTYVTLATLAAGSSEFGPIVNAARMPRGPLILEAISCGAVFFGALTYIGNGPNFMVKAIADEAGFQTPSFFGYLAYSCLILLPVFVLLTFLFFPPF